MKRTIIFCFLLLISSAVRGAGPDEPLTQYWHKRLDVQLAPVEIPDPGHPGQTIKVFRADDMVKMMDVTIGDLNLWADDIDPNRGKPSPLDGPLKKGGNNPLPPAPDLASLEELNNRVTDLSVRVMKLEDEVRDLRNGEHKAPFKVVNAGGKALFTITEDGTVTVGTEGQTAIVMKALASNSALIQLAAGPKRLLMLADGNDAAKLQLNDGPDAAVELNASQGNAGFVRVSGGESNAIINADPANAATLNLQGGPDAGVLLSSKPENLGLLAQKAGQNAASLGVMPGKGVALRLFNESGKQVVSAGGNPASGNAGLVTVGTGDKTAAWLSSEADGAGLVQVFAADGTGAAAMVAKERAVVAYNQAGSPVATISKSGKSEGGTVVARNPDGEGVFAAGFRADVGGGESCVYRMKAQNTFCLGIGMPGMSIGK